MSTGPWIWNGWTAADTTTLYWLVLVGCGVAGLLSLLQLKRLHEFHHLYWGLALGLTCVAQPVPAFAAFPLIVLLIIALPRWWLQLLFPALLALFAFVVPTWIGQVLALLMVCDDAVNHAVQVADVADGRPPRPDWTPIHQLGAWLVAHIGSGLE